MKFKAEDGSEWEQIKGTLSEIGVEKRTIIRTKPSREEILKALYEKIEQSQHICGYHPEFIHDLKLIALAILDTIEKLRRVE